MHAESILRGKDFGGELGTVANIQLGIDIPAMRDRRVLANTQFFRDRWAGMSRQQEQAYLAFPRRQRQIVYENRSGSGSCRCTVTPKSGGAPLTAFAVSQ